MSFHASFCMCEIPAFLSVQKSVSEIQCPELAWLKGCYKKYVKWRQNSFALEEFMLRWDCFVNSRFSKIYVMVKDYILSIF